MHLSIPANQPSTSTNQSSSANSSSSANPFDLRAAQTTETIWCLQMVLKGSDNSNEGLTEDLQAMMHLGPTKVSYIIQHGIYPYLKEVLVKELCNAEFLSLLFDESLNKQTQTQQIKIAVRFVYEGKSNIRYLTSQFLGCATS